MRRVARIMCVAMLATGAAASARAGVITATYGFTATGFTDISSSATPPTDPVTGSFTITYDPTLSYSNDTAGITLNHLNIALAAGLSFSNDPTVPMLIVSDIAFGNVRPGVNDFVVEIPNTTTAPYLALLAYTTAGQPLSTFQTFTGTITASVPEPATIALFGTGLAGLLAAGPRRNRRFAARVTAAAPAAG